MAAFRLVLRRVLEHRARQIIVITVTCGIMLVGVGIGADTYFDLLSKEATLRRDLARAKDESSRLTVLKKRHEGIQSELGQHMRRAVHETGVDAVRDELVMLILDNKCKFRKMELGHTHHQPWTPGANPLDDSDDEIGLLTDSAEYELRKQELTLEVSGQLENVKQLLAQIHDMDRMVHVNSIQMSQDASTARDIEMQVGLLLFGLEKARHPEEEELRGLPPERNTPSPPTLVD